MRRRLGLVHCGAIAFLSFGVVAPVSLANSGVGLSDLGSTTVERVHSRERDRASSHAKATDLIRSMSVTIVTSDDWFAGTDGFVSLDLQVTKVTAGRTWLFFRKKFDLGDVRHADHKHFIRIEYAHNDGRGSDDHRYENWKVGERFRVTGTVRWDTDKLGFLELHPVGQRNVTPLK